MKVAKGSDQALIFFNKVMDQLVHREKPIKKSFTKGITLEEKIFIINALENKKCTFEAPDLWKESIHMVKYVIYDSSKNYVTILPNPDFHIRQREAAIATWPTKITQSF